jgi:hypothetical protein
MKRALIFLACLIGLSAAASIVVLFNPTTGRNLSRIDSANTLEYINRADALINPAFPTSNLAVCKVTNGVIVLLNANEIQANLLSASNANAVAVSAQRSNLIALASAYMYGTNAEGRILRAFALLTLDQVNVLRKTNGMPIITTNTFLNAMSNAVIGDPK